MIINDTVLKYDEKVIFALRELYSRYGYSQYKMSKFEEYDLYVRNKDFLISDGVITFTDTNGRLMALKPDVTLSIIKNSKDIPGFVQKLYYDENVYRVSDRTHTFKEIMQVGLECIGDIDDYSILEVVSLAAKSLVKISDSSVLDISHLGILSAMFDLAGIPESDRDRIMKLVGEKNVHELERECRGLGVEDDYTEQIKALVSTYGAPKTVLPRLKELLCDEAFAEPLSQLENIVASLDGDEYSHIIRIDFSVISDIKYYNGIVFKGFISGIPQSVLSGGQYDRLMRKMQKRSGAVGFAVYLDLLERLISESRKYDVDTVILCDRTANVSTVRKAVEEYAAKGSVSVQRSLPDKYTYKRLVRISEGEVTEIEENT
ncbi:MAG: ATP phosphoribosyltransferase regulatory subunit [Clostridia bacterium]|nr:ATP phosphoribosyltransferase regulatory subunit [Clostridia bacterium]